MAQYHAAERHEFVKKLIPHGKPGVTKKYLLVELKAEGYTVDPRTVERHLEALGTKILREDGEDNRRTYRWAPAKPYRDVWELRWLDVKGARGSSISPAKLKGMVIQGKLDGACLGGDWFVFRKTVSLEIPDEKKLNRARLHIAGVTDGNRVCPGFGSLDVDLVYDDSVPTTCVALRKTAPGQSVPVQLGPWEYVIEAWLRDDLCEALEDWSEAIRTKTIPWCTGRQKPDKPDTRKIFIRKRLGKARSAGSTRGRRRPVDEKLARLELMKRLIPSGGTGVSTEYLRKAMERHGFSVTLRTVQRDLSILSTELIDDRDDDNAVVYRWPHSTTPGNTPAVPQPSALALRWAPIKEHAKKTGRSAARVIDEIAAGRQDGACIAGHWFVICKKVGAQIDDNRWGSARLQLAGVMNGECVEAGFGCVNVEFDYDAAARAACGALSQDLVRGGRGSLDLQLGKTKIEIEDWLKTDLMEALITLDAMFNDQDHDW